MALMFLMTALFGIKMFTMMVLVGINMALRSSEMVQGGSVMTTSVIALELTVKL